MEEIQTTIEALNSITPLGIIAGLGYIIFLQIRNKKGQDEIAGNHLSGLPEMQRTLDRIETKLDKLDKVDEIAEGIVHIKARINGKS